MMFKNEKGIIINHQKCEAQEQNQARRFIKPTSVVLELGARYGMVSCMINKKLGFIPNQVSVEPDPLVHEALENNMKENGCNFHILKGVISNKKYKLVGKNFGTRTEETSEDTNILSYTLDEIESKYNLKFNTLVADCEGFLEKFFDENPNFYKQINLIIFEKDFPAFCNYSKIISNLRLHKFKQIIPGFRQVWIKDASI